LEKGKRSFLTAGESFFQREKKKKGREERAHVTGGKKCRLRELHRKREKSQVLEKEKRFLLDIPVRSRKGGGISSRTEKGECHTFYCGRGKKMKGSHIDTQRVTEMKRRKKCNFERPIGRKKKKSYFERTPRQLDRRSRPHLPSMRRGRRISRNTFSGWEEKEKCFPILKREN